MKPRIILTISDANSARQEAVDFLTQLSGRKATVNGVVTDVERVLVVKQHPVRPISDLVLCVRFCNMVPTEDQQKLVAALSKVDGRRSYTGESCRTGFYAGPDVWGWESSASLYCPSCGWAMVGESFDLVNIVGSDQDWLARMKSQCELAALRLEGVNYGLEYEIEERI